jgi:lanthionine synthetase-like protein
VIYPVDAHEPLTETPWDDVRVRERIAAIVEDAEGTMEDGAWPNHPQDDDEDPPLLDGLTTIYLCAAGMLWALHTLGSTLDLASLADGAVRRYRERPDWGEDVPSLLMGESGILLVAALVGASGHHQPLRERIVENEHNPAWELMWGSPGTMLAARVAGFDNEYERSAAALLAAWDAAGDGIWTQDLYGKTRQYIGPVHGFAGNVHALRGHLSDDDLRRRIEGPLRKLAVAEDGLVNWLPTVDSEQPSRLQWCHGSAGMVATLGDLMPRELMVGGSELTWRAGPLAKGPGLCHGTAGNGYALLRAHELTGDREWLDRARRFAVHALEQVDRARDQHGRGRYTLFTGDVGAALFARSCLEVDPRFPTMVVW